jgi:hypothetical protein
MSMLFTLSMLAHSLRPRGAGLETSRHASVKSGAKTSSNEYGGGGIVNVRLMRFVTVLWTSEATCLIFSDTADVTLPTNDFAPWYTL